MENKFFNLDVKIKINIMPMMLIIIMQTKIITTTQVAKKPVPLRELKRESQVEALRVFSPRQRGLAPEYHLITFSGAPQQHLITIAPDYHYSHH